MTTETRTEVELLDLPQPGRMAAAVPRAGLILLATDMTTERDAARLLPALGIAAHATRVPFDNPTTPETLRRMGPHLSAAAALLAPLVPLSAVYYSCTSATVTLGGAAVAAAIGEALPGVPVVTPPEAALAALEALGARRIALLTPYVVETTEPFVDWFAAGGLEILRACCLGIEDDRDMARLDTPTLVEAAAAADHPEAEALFLSCTAVPALAAVEAIEARLGKPVVTSNQAALWQIAGHCARHAPGCGPGRLFTQTPTGARPAVPHRSLG